MSLETIAGYHISDSGAGSFTVLSLPVDPKCIIHHRFPVVGDVVTYTSTNCTRIVDSAAGSFTLDSSGVPTIVGATGTLGYDWGVYACTISLNGNSEVVHVSHSEDATIRAGFSFNLDANGWSIITPPTGARLLYVDPAAADDTSAGPAGLSNDYYVMGTNEPAGGWKTPTSINAYKTMAGAYAAMRDGQADYMLLLDTAVHVPAAMIDFNGKSGASVTARLMITSYGTTGTARAHINPTHSDDAILNVFAEEYIGFTDLDIYPTIHNPLHGDFNGWGVDTPPGTGIQIYTGGGLPGAKTGFLIENCRIRYCSSGIGFTGEAALSDAIIRRNVIEWNFDETDRAQGFSLGARRTTPLEYPDMAYYLGENIIDHNGWYAQAYDISGTATAGSTTALTHTGAFTGLSLETVAVADVANGGFSTITSNDANSLVIAAAANVDFTGGGAYLIGARGAVTYVEDHAQGQALAFNHNCYVRYSRNALIENNIITRGSSMGIKNTADSATQAEEEDADNFPTDNFIQQWNLIADNEIGTNGAGNTDLGFGPSFNDCRVTDNAIFNTGASQPTNRTLSQGAGAADWKNGLFGSNLFLKNASVTTNTYGLAISGHFQNSVVAKNICFDNGSGTAAANGSFYVQDATPGYSNVYIYNNDFQQQNDDGVVIGEYDSTLDADFTWANNRYFAKRAAASAVNLDGSADTIANFLAATGETGSSVAAVNYTDHGAAISNYQISRGGTATEAAFIAEAVAQDKASWDTTLEAEEVVAYFKDAFSDRPDIVFEVANLALLNGIVGDEQTIAFSNVGIPKGAIFIKPHTSDKGLGVTYAAGGWSIGFADDAGNQWFSHSNLDTEVTPDQRCDMRQYDGAIAGFVKRGEWALADTDFFTNNQIKIQLTDKGSSVPEEAEMFIIAIGGADVDSVKVGSYDDLGTTTDAQTLTTGHRTDMLFASTVFRTIIHDAWGGGGDKWNEANTVHSMGVAINNQGTIEQMGLARYHDDGFSPTIANTSTTNAIYDDSILANVAYPSTENFSVSIDSFTSTGVTLSCDANPASEILGYLSVSFKKRPKMKIVNTTVSATSNVAISDIGFKGGFCFWQNLIGSTAYNTPEAIKHSAAITIADGTGVWTASIGANEGIQNVDTGCFAYADEGFDIPVKGIGATLEVASTAGQLTFTDDGVDVTLGTQSTETIPGRILVLGVN